VLLGLRTANDWRRGHRVSLLISQAPGGGLHALHAAGVREGGGTARKAGAAQAEEGATIAGDAVMVWDGEYFTVYDHRVSIVADKWVHVSGCWKRRRGIGGGAMERVCLDGQLVGHCTRGPREAMRIFGGDAAEAATVAAAEAAEAAASADASGSAEVDAIAAGSADADDDEAAKAKAATAAASAAAARTGLSLRVADVGTGPCFIADVRVWSSALHAGQVRKGMTKRLTGKEDRLLGHWPLLSPYEIKHRRARMEARVKQMAQRVNATLRSASLGDAKHKTAIRKRLENQLASGAFGDDQPLFMSALLYISCAQVRQLLPRIHHAAFAAYVCTPVAFTSFTAPPLLT
jgi:pyruvate/2-oxoglutarate dehydrogenase complex dihydrolipoamide acyltransferase (E2) component